MAAHHAVFGTTATANGSGDADADLTRSFAAAYDLGASLLRPLGAVLPGWCDGAVGAGHAVRACVALTALAPSPAASDAACGAAAVDVREACPGEVALMEGPVREVEARVRELLSAWPDHPGLGQLAALCVRLHGMPCGCPLREAMVGLELLLSKGQAWEETAAKHVSLGPALVSASALAQRWRRLELAGWEGAVERAREAHAALAHRGWFHLVGLVLGESSNSNSNGDEGVVPSIEHFLQTSTAGQFRRRLSMLWAFSAHLAESGGGERHVALSHVLGNTFR